MLTALANSVYGSFSALNGFDAKFVNAAASRDLILLAVYLIITAILKLRNERPKNELIAVEH